MKHVLVFVLAAGCSSSGAGLDKYDSDLPVDGDTDDTDIEIVLPPGDLGLPDGLLAYFDSADCPEGWSEFMDSRGRALVAVNQPDDIGVTVADPLDTEIPPTHEHTIKATFDVGGAGIGGSTGCCNNAPGASGEFLAEGNLEALDSDVPTVTMRVCRRDRPEGPPAAGLSLPTGASAFVDAEVCPDGMTPALEAEGRFVIGQGEGGTVGEIVGTALESGEIRVHEHTASLSFTIPQRSLSLAGGGNMDHAAKGMHETEATSGIGNIALPYLQTLFCEVDVAATSEGGLDERLPSGAIIYANTPDCPEVWVEDDFTVGRFTLGQQNGVFVGSTHEVALEVGEDRLHTHTHSLEVRIPSRNIAGISGCCFSGAGRNGTFAVNGEVDPASRGLPYIALKACRRP